MLLVPSNTCTTACHQMHQQLLCQDLIRCQQTYIDTDTLTVIVIPHQTRLESKFARTIYCNIEAHLVSICHTMSLLLVHLQNLSLTDSAVLRKNKTCRKTRKLRICLSTNGGKNGIPTPPPNHYII